MEKRVVLDLFSHTAICLNCLHRLPNCLLSVLIMCAAVIEESRGF